MHTTHAKRIEIVIEAPLLGRLTEAMESAGVTGYTVLPVLAGSGHSGPWSREGQVSTAGGMVTVLCVVGDDRADAMLEAAFAVVERHIGIVSMTDCQVVRGERF